MKELKKRIADGSLENLCLLFGEESYLIRRFESDITELTVPGEARAMNFTPLSEKEATAASVEGACEIMPFMAEKRLVLVKNSKLFLAGRKDESEKLAAYVSDIPETARLVFIENEVDKRGRLYKRLAENGRVVESKAQKEEDLIPWAAKIFEKNGVAISRGLAAAFVRAVGPGMDRLASEAEKLAAYKGWEGEISRANIDAVCSKSLEANVFELVSAVGDKNPGRALDIFSNLILLKESPIMVISTIARQLRMTLECKVLLEKRLSHAQIAAKLGLWDRAAREYAKRAAGSSETALVKGLFDCLEADLDVKTGRADGKSAVERLIIRLAHI